MNNFKELKNEFKNLKGTFLIIGDIDENLFSIFDESPNLTEMFYLNNKFQKKAKNIEIDAEDITENMHLKDLHKYFKNGIDNIWCNYEEIKDYLPSFVRESLRITKKNIYIFFDKKSDYKKIASKYKRYNLNCNFYSIENYNFAIVEANDLIVHFFKETYYYIVDSIENAYNYICNNI